MKRQFAIAVFVLSCVVWCPNLSAQGIGGALRGIGKKAADKATGKATDKAEDKLDQPSADADKSEPPTDTKPAPSQPAQAVDGQPSLTAPKIDFVPGEKTIFFDDFSDMAADEPPPHWKVRGGKVDLRTGGNIRELAPGDGVTLTSPTVAVPKNFTLEIVWTGGGEIGVSFRSKDDSELMSAMMRGEEDGQTASTSVEFNENLGDGSIKTDTSKPVGFGLWVQQGRLRAYLNGERLVDANQIDTPPIDHITLQPSRYRPNGLRSFRIAESAPDFSTVIASGKYVSHGINFDIDSDRLKPESAGVLKMVANGLQKNSNLKLTINGYTDSTGDPAHNLDLSKRRAAAVRAVLISQFGVDAARLTSGGFGSAGAIGSNDTPDGRAQNRRVEFVKQ
jgi:OmpA-OmpF porin, OOP family